MRRTIVVCALLLGAATPVTTQAPGSVRVVVPASVWFQVTDVSSATTASGGLSRVSFDRARLRAGEALRISVRADGDLTGPGGAIPASTITWTTSNVTGGIGVNGTLSKATYTPVFESQIAATAGQVDLTWTMTPPGASMRAGTHQALLRWRFEAVIP